MESRALICLQAQGSLFTELGEVWDSACPSQDLSFPPALCSSSSWNSSWSSQGLQLPEPSGHPRTALLERTLEGI